MGGEQNSKERMDRCVHCVRKFKLTWDVWIGERVSNKREACRVGGKNVAERSS